MIFCNFVFGIPKNLEKYIVLSDVIDCDFRDRITSAYDPNTIALNIIPRYQCVPGSYLPTESQENGGYPSESSSVGGGNMPDCTPCASHCSASGTVCEYPCDSSNPTLTCDEFTSVCKCVNERIVGDKCNECKREYWQNFPDCSEGTIKYITLTICNCRS